MLSKPDTSMESSLERLVEENEFDQNFPQDVLFRARKFLKDARHGSGDMEKAQEILSDFQEYKDLIAENSPYPEVRAVVDPTDDPTLPVCTIRAFVIGTILVIMGTAISVFFSFRMPTIHISVYIVQVLAMPLGKAATRWLPTRKFGRGRWQFTLNPGSFNQKEHILIAMMANIAFGGMTNGAYVITIIQMLKLDVFYGEKVLSNSVPWQVVTMLASQFIGYSCAGMARRFLVYPPSMIWMKPLAYIALTKALYNDNGPAARVSANGWSITRFSFFLICFGAMFVWYWVPNYLVQAFSLFNWPTWFSPGNVLLAIVTGSSCGLGLNPLPTLDWNIATHHGDPIVTPFFTLMNYAAGMALTGFVAAPLLYFNNVWKAGYFPINSNRIFDSYGHVYDVKHILTKDMRLNETAYSNYSIPRLSTTQTLNYLGFFNIYPAVMMHIIFWHRKDVVSGLKSLWKRKTRAEEFRDVHNRLMSAYPECPNWWYLAMLAISFALACISVTVWPTGTPIWSIVVAIIFTFVFQIPVGIIAAITNMEVSTSVLAQVIGGYALEGRPIPNMIFKMFSFMSTSQSLNFIADLKMAHYAKIPPRCAFFVQLYATMLAGVVALTVNHWVLHNVDDICQPGQPDRFTCPATHSYFMASVLWGAIGPRRIFGPGAPYTAITWFMPLGFILPIVAYFAAKRWPGSLWRSVNVPVFIAGPMGWAPYNWSYMQGTVMLAVFFNGIIKKRYRAWWERYAYVLTAAFGAGIGVAGVVMFFGLQMRNTRLHWWGNVISKQGVDQGGWIGENGLPVRCANLQLPEGGYIA
ncbi:OPT oligopeptide transporter protein-domain-containing protein [Stachybotrys elegans]|uniref:OPT oligopeptide transporter protein-domain-containing protein n=1 Tax=Stachybotrys elegans TaxID=80388 RepID=A0A8K0T324_9HYPO|nr:OPT oligopeptide transporter protein-domain-containing protein [Stachybotrys elegans]